MLEFFIARTGDEPGTLDFDADMRACVARHGKGRLSMPVLPGADFYLIEAGKPDWSMKLRANELCEALKRCEKAGVNAWQNSYAERTLKDLDRYRKAGGTMHWLCLGKPDWDRFPEHIDDAPPCTRCESAARPRTSCTSATRRASRTARARPRRWSATPSGARACCSGEA